MRDNYIKHNSEVVGWLFSLKYRKLGLKIQYVRKLRGLNQTDLASAAGISTSYLSEIERGSKVGAPLSIYWKLSEALGVDLSDLLKD